MTLLKDREVMSPQRTPATANSPIGWTLGVVGSITAAIGAWMLYGPAEGTLQLFGWSWEVSGLAEAWPYSLLIVGLLAIAAGAALIGDRLAGGRMRGMGSSSALSATVVAVAAIAGAITYGLIWIF